MNMGLNSLSTTPFGSMGSSMGAQTKTDSLPAGMFGYDHLLANYRTSSGSGSGSGSGSRSSSDLSPPNFNQTFPNVTPSPPNVNAQPLPQNSWFFSNFAESPSPPTQMASSFDMNVDLEAPVNFNPLNASGRVREKVLEPALNDAAWQEYMRQVFVNGGGDGSGAMF